jgi:hypothetical protein
MRERCDSSKKPFNVIPGLTRNPVLAEFWIPALNGSSQRVTPVGKGGEIFTLTAMAERPQQKMKVFRSASWSFPRRRESREVRWIPAFAGMTAELLYKFTMNRIY